MKKDIFLTLNIGFGRFWSGRGAIWPTISQNEEEDMEKIAPEAAEHVSQE